MIITDHFLFPYLFNVNFFFSVCLVIDIFVVISVVVVVFILQGCMHGVEESTESLPSFLHPFRDHLFNSLNVKVLEEKVVSAPLLFMHSMSLLAKKIAWSCSPVSWSSTSTYRRS